MDEILKALGELGVPDRIGVVGNLRKGVADMLVKRAREMGPDAFRTTLYRLANFVVLEATRKQS